MSFDKQALFSEAQAITVTAVSTNFLNLGVPKTPPGSPAPLKRDIGGGNNVPLTINVDADFAGLTSLTATIEVAVDDAFTAPKVAGSTGPIPLASLVRNAKLPLNMVPFGADMQYMRLNYTVVGTATAGTVTAGISLGVNTNVGQ